ncbi:response regulator [Paenibacillus herberti]|uniref:DNA-binding response regulator n=1 Tax=Paenibacillus herberti TaxID=1619309 RepID=A0A229P2K8_9BACL|nr:response regulator [Paenibacillus herberti]OXM16330.1 hypothetical protein CGZ75_06495 [Paenibacillus herberti]
MREITCLVIDDEPPMVYRLQRYFERWTDKQLPFRLVGHAFSGDEALEKVAQLKPDLILTDIVMPGMSGIELIRELRERMPRIEILILSAYSDFSTARQAITMGVFEYLVKVPLREEDVLTALSKVRDNIIAREEKESKLLSLSGSVKENRYRLRKHLLEELLNGEISASIMERRSAELAPGFDARHYAGFSVQFDDYEAFCAEFSPSDRNKLKYAMYNIIEEVLQENGGSFVCELQPNVIAACASLPSISEQALDRSCYELGRRLVEAIKTYLRISVSVGVSRACNGWSQASTTFKEAESALTDAFYTGFGTVVTPSRRLVYTENDWMELTERFERALERMSAKSTRETLTPLLALLGNYRANPARLIHYMENWCSRLRQRLLSAEKDEAKVSFAGCIRLHQLIERLRLVWQQIETATEGSGLRPEIVKAKRYVEDHLTESISLSILAEHIHLNPSYVSELFKKELGINFTDYVAKRRIERAIELLRKRSYSNLELAEAVGVYNEKYFCTLFKKITGTSPQKFFADN